MEASLIQICGPLFDRCLMAGSRAPPHRHVPHDHDEATAGGWPASLAGGRSAARGGAARGTHQRGPGQPAAAARLMPDGWMIGTDRHAAQVRGEDVAGRELRGDATTR